jgi:predicted lipoprotein with Yx(FWY)xxD motif
MRRLPFLGLALGAVAVTAAGCGGGGDHAAAATGYGGAAAKPASAAVKTVKTELGTVLADADGRTLYLFEKDKGTTSRCSGACAGVWPPLAGAKPGATGGVAAGKLGDTKRADGTSEVTYAGHPLYTYAGDAKPGDVKGQGLDQFGAEWYALAPSGQKIDDDDEG